MNTPIPRRLAAPEPSWERAVDVAVIGSGAAGLAVGLAARPLRDVLILTKGRLDAGSTAWAQGGLAGVLHPDDSLDDHVRDTLVAGAGLCDAAVVAELVSEAPKAIRYLVSLGAMFDADPAAGPGPALTREGGHSHQRIVHAGGDRSGAEVQRTLDQAAVAAGVDVLESAFALDLVTGTTARGERRAAGVTVALLDGAGRVVSVGLVRARAVVLACGGWGQVFAATSNPPAVTGDGVAIALRAGLAVSDVEFVQFHPTVLYTGPDTRGQRMLVSEAVRGEGAVLYDTGGVRVMAGVHSLEDLAPRDVVAAAITARMAACGDDHVLLDATHLGEHFYTRFPGITEACRAAGLDPARDRIPVAPAAHYSCGGVPAGLDGVTALAGLYAVGEVARTGVHGANRLASNSLTESIVAGSRLGRALEWDLGEPVVALDRPPNTGVGLLPGSAAGTVRRAMSRHVGVLRSAESLAAAGHAVEAAFEAAIDAPEGAVGPCQATFEATNIATVAGAMTAAAAARLESRGCHRRSDFDEPREAWRKHLGVRLGDVTPFAVEGDAEVC